ncbi:hypothetical protein EDD86DRAFT_192331 [Gorgonomyces haynaldii]|nr:hypothetical protein EDD86DRAFT_192331 [Gorgonomyces haynaldii]
MGQLKEIQVDQVFVLSTSLCHEGDISPEAKLTHEWGRDDTLASLESAFLQATGKQPTVLRVSLKNMKSVIEDLAHKQANGVNLVVINTCDGTEEDGYPGQSVVQMLQQHKIPYSGSDLAFYMISTSKPELKRKLLEAHVPTSPFQEVHSLEDLKQLVQLVGWPLIIKPSVSYASINITKKSVVSDCESALEQIKASKDIPGGIFAEAFLGGREFTVLVTGDQQHGLKVYKPAERVFRQGIPVTERILAFDEYWEGYDLEGNSPDKPAMYHYALAPSEWCDTLSRVAQDAYIACQGTGYGRVDIRTKTDTECEPMVLEVNANCGLSFGKGSSSLGDILELNQVSPAAFCADLVHYALHRFD